MRILMITPVLSLGPGDETLTNELVAALAADGHDVQVVLLDWNAAPGSPNRRAALGPRANVLVIAPVSVRGLGLFVERATKWLFSSWVARHAMRRELVGQSYDLLIGLSPAVVCLAQLRFARRLARRRYMILWDFFPFHQRAIGLVTNPLVFAVAFHLEQSLIRGFDTIGCMSPANVAYLRAHYRLRHEQTTAILPIWGRTTEPDAMPRATVRARFDLPLDKRIVVFGGQLTEGRGVEDILAAADLAAIDHPELAFLVIGDGRLAATVAESAGKQGATLLYRRRIPRETYLELLSACDAGLVCTVRHVDVPTFPSKTIDYLRAGLPIVASVEASTDYGAFIEAEGLGAACLAGDPQLLLATAVRVVADAALAAAIRVRSRDVLARDFDVTKAARAIAATAEAA